MEIGFSLKLKAEPKKRSEYATPVQAVVKAVLFWR